MYSFDPKTDKIEHLGDLSEICGEKDMKVVAHGKSHVNFVESNGKLYFVTHLGYYCTIDGKEKTGILVCSREKDLWRSWQLRLSFPFRPSYSTY
jgi:hypothetical protein